MSYQVPQAIANKNKQFLIGITISTTGKSQQFEHRGMVIRSVCDLEYELARLLFFFFKSRNPVLTWERAEEELFRETKPLNSLNRMVLIAEYLALVSADESYDLRRFATLRNKYAHGRNRRQLDEDPETAQLVRSLRLFLNSQDTLGSHDNQGIFLACAAFLEESMQARQNQLGTVSDSDLGSE